MRLRYEEIEVGSVYQTDTYTVTKEDIIDFASKYDPQYFHIDETKAEESMFHGLIASGLHTMGMCWRLWVDQNVIGDDVVAGVGFDNVRFVRPVYAGDTLSVTATFTDKKEDRKPERGFVTLRLEGANQRQERVLDVSVTFLVKRRN